MCMLSAILLLHLSKVFAMFGDCDAVNTKHATTDGAIKPQLGLIMPCS